MLLQMIFSSVSTLAGWEVLVKEGVIQVRDLDHASKGWSG